MIRESIMPIHSDVNCDGCGQKDMRGIRYKCGHCTDYDLCQICYSFNKHDSSHLFIIINHPRGNIPSDKPLLSPFTHNYFGTQQNSQQQQQSSIIVERPFYFGGFPRETGQKVPETVKQPVFKFDPPQPQQPFIFGFPQQPAFCSPFGNGQ